MKRQILKKRGIDLTGSGSYQSELGLNFQKIYYPSFYHPIRIRLNLSFSAPTYVSIKGLSIYGGGTSTSGKVFPGYEIHFLFSPEVSLTQSWVITTDIIYSHTFQGNFTGTKGIEAEGNPPHFNLLAKDTFHLSPSIEYNLNENLGVIGGIWFTPLGTNTRRFVGSVFSVTSSF